MGLLMGFSCFRDNYGWGWKSKNEWIRDIKRSYIEKMLYANKYWYEYINKIFKCVINKFIL